MVGLAERLGVELSKASDYTESGELESMSEIGMLRQLTVTSMKTGALQQREKPILCKPIAARHSALA